MYQLEQAVQALDIQLSDAEIEALEELYESHGVLGHQAGAKYIGTDRKT